MRAATISYLYVRYVLQLSLKLFWCRYGMVESVTSSVVEHVPGGNYAREKLTEGLDRLEDATGNVVDVVPGQPRSKSAPHSLVIRL